MSNHMGQEHHLLHHLGGQQLEPNIQELITSFAKEEEGSPPANESDITHACLAGRGVLTVPPGGKPILSSNLDDDCSSACIEGPDNQGNNMDEEKNDNDDNGCKQRRASDRKQSNALVISTSAAVLMGGRAISLEDCAPSTGIPEAVLSSLIPSASLSRSSSSSSCTTTTPRTPSGGGVWSYLSAWQLPSLPSTPSSVASSSSGVRAVTCGMCTERFTLFRRSHRCRRCHGSFCVPCSRHYIVLGGEYAAAAAAAAAAAGVDSSSQKPQRVCDRCFVFVKDQEQQQFHDVSPLRKDYSSSSSSGFSSFGDSRTSSISLGEEEEKESHNSSSTAKVVPSSSSATPTSESSPYEALKLKPEMNRYFKMLAVGVPAIAITHKMAADGIEDDWIKIFVGGGKAKAAAGGGHKKAMVASTSATASSSSSSSDTRRPPSYPRSSSSSSSASGPITATASFKLRPVHFEQLTPERAEKSVFKSRKSSVAQSTEARTSVGGHSSLSPSKGQHVKELAELFSVTQRPNLPGLVSGKGGRPAFGAALDSRRLQNVGIVYNYFKKSYDSSEALVLTILRLQDDGVPAERLPGLLEIMPSPEEQKKLRLAAGLTHDLFRPAPTKTLDGAPYPPTPVVPLHEAEVFMLATMKVPRMTAKVRSYHFWVVFAESARALDAKMEALARVFTDVMQSDRLVRVLEVLLYIGNTLNAYSGSSNAGVVIEAFTIDSLFRVALTKSTTCDVTLLDYFVRLAAEKGEGAILSVAQDMPTLPLAVALPDCSAVLRDVRTWLWDFDAVKYEATKEQEDLAAYVQARAGRKEAQQRAEEARQAELKAKQDAERLAQRVAAQRALARQESLRALTERLAMEKEDATMNQGEHFVRFLEESEEQKEDDPELWADIVAVLHASGPPLPLELKLSLLLRQRPAAAAADDDDEEDGFYDARQDEEDEEDEDLAGILRLNEELGSCQGDDAAQQRLLRAASRWLGARLKVTNLLTELATARQGVVTSSKTTVDDSAPPPAKPSSETGGGRMALLAALRGRGGGSARRGKLVSTPKTGTTDDELRVLYEGERIAFVQHLAHFVSSAEARVSEVSTQCNALDKQAQGLYEYFGEDPANASSARILLTLHKFLQQLGLSITRYERKYGKILTPDMLVDDDDDDDDVLLSDDFDETSARTPAKKLKKRRRRRSSLPPLMVGQRLATAYGPGVVEAVRVKDRTTVVHFTTWNATGYLNADALLGVGARVTTAFGDGDVEDVQRQVGTYQVRLGWGATLFTSFANIRVKAGSSCSGSSE